MRRKSHVVALACQYPPVSLGTGQSFRQHKCASPMWSTQSGRVGPNHFPRVPDQSKCSA